jgi:polyhydroxyalkanoate synthase
MVNPPDNPKAAFQALPAGTGPAGAAPANPADPRDFLSAAQTVPGSWWTDYSGWLARRSGGRRAAPDQLGSPSYPVRCAAPGTYVHDR